MEVGENGDFLDLSFLTGEEQKTITQVLERDTQLKEKDEQRVRKLRSCVSDPCALKRLSGDWFSDVRASRPWGQVGGVDIVRASIRRKKKTRAEWDHNWGYDDAEVNGNYESETSEDDEIQKSETRLPSDLPPQELSDDIQDGSTSQDGEENSTPDPIPMRRRIPSVGELGMEEIHLSPIFLMSEENHSENDLLQQKSLEGDGHRNLGYSPSVPTLGNQSMCRTVCPKKKLSESFASSLSLTSTLPSFQSKRSCQQIPLYKPVPNKQLKKLSGSMMSLFSAGEIHSLEVQGWIQFSLQYDTSKKELRILVIQCRDLTAAHSQTSNPYVKCYLLPDKSVQGKRKTKVKKKTLDPLFNETLKVKGKKIARSPPIISVDGGIPPAALIGVVKYKLERSEIQSRFLNLSVWHRGSLARNAFLGEVELDLATWDWSQTQPAWHNLQPRTPLSPEFLYSRGRLNLAAKFTPQGAEGLGLPPSGELHIWVKEAQQLVPHKAGQVSSYVKCCVLPDDSPSSFQRTRVISRSLRPMYNHTMVYDGFRSEDLSEACVEFTVWDQGTMSSKPLGGIRLSIGKGNSYEVPVSWMDSTEQEKKFWQLVINRPGEWSEVTLPLRQNLTPR